MLSSNFSPFFKKEIINFAFENSNSMNMMKRNQNNLVNDVF